MTPLKEQTSHTTLKILLAVCVVGIIILSVIVSNHRNMHEIAPGLHNVQDDFIIAENHSKAVPMPSVKVPKIDSPSYGELETPNGNFDLIGL